MTRYIARADHAMEVGMKSFAIFMCWAAMNATGIALATLTTGGPRLVAMFATGWIFAMAYYRPRDEL